VNAFPSIPNEHALAALIITLVALILFSRERIPLETSSLAVIVVLAIGFSIFPFETDGQRLDPTDFFTGFGHQALIAVCALMIVGHGLVRTGALEPVGRVLSKLWSYNPAVSLGAALLVAATLSAFVNNTPIVVLLLPILVTVSVRTKTSASGVMMPMGFATIVGGMATTIGTSTNLLVVSVAADLGLPRIGMFDFMLPAVIAGSAGILYLWLVAPRLLPDRNIAMADLSPRVFTAQLHIPANSFGDGKSLRDILDRTQGRMKVARIRKPGDTFTLPLPDAAITAGDRLQLRDTPQNLKEFEQILGGQLYSHDHLVDEDNPLREEDQQLAELVIDRGSPMVHRTLNEVRLTEVYQLATIAIHRKGRILESMPKGIDRVKLRLGDVLLVQGARENIEEVKRRGQFLVLDATTELPDTHRAPRAIAIMTGIVLVSAFGILPISISAVCGAMLMMLTNCLKWRDIQRALSVQVILIVVASLAIGNALISTGAANYLAECFLVVTEGMSAHTIFTGLMILMAVLTNIVSNNAAAVIGTPIAISIAQHLGLPEEAFVLAVLFGANMSFATPMAYNTNLLVMNAAGYTFGDFVKVGVPLIVVMLVVLSIVLPMIYQF
jgi:di/tricarboxylate transporter